MAWRRRGYGWKKDRADARDYPYTKAVTLVPQSSDLRRWCSPIEDQGQLGSCTAQAIVGGCEFLELMEGQKLVDLSRLMLYYDERLIEGTVMEDSGAEIRDGIKSMAKTGTCPESEWPYIISQFMDRPPAQAFADAAAHRIVSYYRLTTLDDMLNCIAAGFPFVFGCLVFPSFERNTVALTGCVPMPSRREVAAGPIGGHAMLAVGYSMGRKRFTVRNSWGTKWGKKGYCTMPFAYLGDPNLTQDVWTIRR